LKNREETQISAILNENSYQIFERETLENACEPINYPNPTFGTKITAMTMDSSLNRALQGKSYVRNIKVNSPTVIRGYAVVQQDFRR